MPKCYASVGKKGARLLHSSLQCARETARVYIRERVEIYLDTTDFVKIFDPAGKEIQTIDAYSIYGDDFDFDSLTVSIVF